MLLEDFQDQFGGPRAARVPDWATDTLVADVDGSGFTLRNIKLKPLLIGRPTLHASSYATLDSNVLMGGGTDATADLNSALAALGVIGGGTLVMDGAALISAPLRIPSNVTVYCPTKACGGYLAANSNCPMFTNSNYTSLVNAAPSGTRQSDISVVGGTWNGNQANQSKFVAGNVNNSWVTGCWLNEVDRLILDNVTILDAKTFAYMVTYPDNPTVLDCTSRWETFNISTSQDGLHLWGPATGTLYVRAYRHINGSDDAIALNYCESQEATGVTLFTAGLPVAAVNTVIDGLYQENGAQTVRIDARFASVGTIIVKNVYSTFNSTYALNNSINGVGFWDRLLFKDWTVSYLDAANNDTKNVILTPANADCLIEFDGFKADFQTTDPSVPLQGGSFFKYGSGSAGAKHIYLRRVTYTKSAPTPRGGLFYMIQSTVTPSKVTIDDCEISGCEYLYGSETVGLTKLNLGVNNLNGAVLFAVGGVAPVLVESIITSESAVESWVAPTLLNGWVNNGIGQRNAGYRKEGNRVWLRGLIKDGTTTFGTNLFVLPVGCWPTQVEIFPAVGGVDALDSTVGRYQVDLTGQVQILKGDAGYFNLSNMSFALD